MQTLILPLTGIVL